MDVNKFSKWLNAELKARDWKQIDLVKKSGVSVGQISRPMTGTRGASDRSILSIAKALKLPPVQVFEAAGFLPESKSDQWLEEMQVLLEHISPADREAVGIILRTYAERKDK